MNYGRYEIVKELGRGAMGVVYQAHDPQIDRLVALKVLRHDRVTSEEFVQRFFKEARAIGRLSHPNIVTVFDVGKDHGTIYIAMEFLEGKPLSKVIKENELNNKAEILDIGIQIAEALNYAHQKKVVHRDIKPSNIIILTDGQVKITDFGIARIEDAAAIKQTQAGEILGTPVYMSPEQVSGKSVDGRSDLYSLGVILYELFVGRRPFTGDSIAVIFTAIIQNVPMVPVQVNSEVSKVQSDLIMKSLHKDPDKRFQTGKEMAASLAALNSILGDDTTFSPSQPILPKKKSFSKGLFIVFVFIAATMTAGYIAYHLISPENSVNLAVKKALVKVVSTPAGAQVFVDNFLKGETPLDMELPLGKHEIRLSLSEYYGWEASLQLDQDVEIPLVVRLVPFAETKNDIR